MNSSRVFAVLACLVFASLTPERVLQAQQGMISPVQADRAGLIVQWFSQLDTTDAESIVDLALVIDENRATTYFQISGGGLRETLSEHDIGPDGTPYGVEGGREFAEIHKEIFEARLKRDEKEAEVTIEQFSIPESTLYTVSRTGMLNAIDAETGKMRWRIEVGDRRLPTVGLGASKNHLAVINGSTVACLDAKTGKIHWERKLQSAVAGSPAVNDDFIFVPMANGVLETLPFKNTNYARSTYVAVGTPTGTTAPVLEGRSVVWATNRGVTVAPANKIASMRFRINSDSDVVAAPVARGGVIFMASIEGFVYAVEESRGSLLWQFPIGERISTKPIPLDNDLFVITENDNLFRFDARTGKTIEGWEKPLSGIKQYVGASQDRLYLLNKLGELLTVDRATGTRLSTVSGNLSLRTFSNLQSDRLYVCHQTGLVQCLREPGNERPKFHSDDWMDVAQAETDTNKDPMAQESGEQPFNPFGGSTPPAANNPFGGDASPPADNDPFGGSSKTPPANNDPFGGSATTPPANNDPFGGGSTNPPAGDMSNDPFGGGSTNPPPSNDPFGGGAASGDSKSDSGAATNDPFAAGGMLPEKSDDSSAESESKVTTWSNVQGIFKQSCGTCHSARSKKGGLDVSTYAAIMEGGDSGPSIVAGDSAGSRLYLLVTHADEPAMPPGPNGKKLSDANIKKIETWINDGALEKEGAGEDSKAPPESGADPFGG